MPSREHRAPAPRRGGPRAARALAALLLLALCAALASVPLSGASFTQSTRAAATLGAGTLQLTLGRDGSALLDGTLAPAGETTAIETLRDDGNLPATLHLRADGLAGSPALAGTLVVTVVDHASGARLWRGTLAALGDGASLGALDPGVARALEVTLSWPADARDPALQDATARFRFAWQAVSASFTSDGANPQTIAAAGDFTPPTASRAVVQKALGGVPGFVRPGGGYRLYASVADGGSPPSGLATATADLTALTPGAASAPLAAGAFVVGGQAYDHASGTLLAGAVPAGAAAFSLALADRAGNSATQAYPAGAVVDGTPPRALDVQAANGGPQAGVVEPGDSLAYGYSEPIDPISLIPGWDGRATAVTVTVANQPAADTVVVSAGATTVPLGVVALNAKYVSASATFNATLSVDGSDVVLVLGTMTSGKTRQGTSAAMTWTPAAGAFDRAGNAALTTAVTESGAFDKDF